MKRAWSVLAALALLFNSVFFVRAEGGENLNDLAACRRVFAYSGDSSAYFYGFYGKNLCSVRVFPEKTTFKAVAEGSVLAMCHDEETACALYKTGEDKYGAALLNVKSGQCVCRKLETGEAVQFTSIAFSNGEVFVITVEKGQTFVTGCAEDGKYKYRFSADVRQLFVNNSLAYAITEDDSIYRLSRGSKTFCRTLPEGGMVENAGCGYVYSSKGALVSLSGGAEYPRAKHAVASGGVTYTDNKAMLLAAVGNNAAILSKDHVCEIKDIGQTEKPESSEKPYALQKINGSFFICDAETSVAAFTKAHPEVVELLDKYGGKVTKGKIKTGYYAVTAERKAEIAVKGDLNGNAYANNEDARVLMRFLLDSRNLSECEKAAADMNGDGAIDNRDLVLLARAAA